MPAAWSTTRKPRQATKVPIDIGIPVPRKKRKVVDGRSMCVYPWYVLGKGESFFTERKHASMSSAVTEMAKKSGFKYICRPDTKDGVQGTRVWRVK